MSYVYFIGPDWGFKRIKIGYTRSSLRARLAGLQTGCPWPLKVYAYMEGGLDLERVFHETFAPLRLQGEWFQIALKLESFLVWAEDCGDREPITDERFRIIMEDVMTNDMPPHPSIDMVDWIDSADTGVLSSWDCDRAWAAYQAGRTVQ